MAAAMAQEHGAKLTGVDISTNAAFEGNWRDRAAEIGDRFEAVARARGVPFRYRAASGESVSNLFVHSADLFLATQPHVDTAHLAYEAVPEKTLLTEGVPGLILPCFCRKREIGKSVLVAWNASREATRAVHDALPILKKAERVVILAFERHYEGKKTDMDALVAHLANHGSKRASRVGQILAILMRSARFLLVWTGTTSTLLLPALTDTPAGWRVSSAA